MKREMVEKAFKDCVESIVILHGGKNTKLDEQLGKVQARFSYIVQSLEEQAEFHFQDFYKLALLLHESEADDYEKCKIILKVLELLKRGYQEFYLKYQKDIILLLYDNVKAFTIAAELLTLLQTVDQDTLPYPDYINIQAQENHVI